MSIHLHRTALSLSKGNLSLMCQVWKAINNNPLFLLEKHYTLLFLLHGIKIKIEMVMLKVLHYLNYKGHSKISEISVIFLRFY